MFTHCYNDNVIVSFICSPHVHHTGYICFIVVGYMFFLPCRNVEFVKRKPLSNHLALWKCVKTIIMYYYHLEQKIAGQLVQSSHTDEASHKQCHPPTIHSPPPPPHFYLGKLLSLSHLSCAALDKTALLIGAQCSSTKHSQALCSTVYPTWEINSSVSGTTSRRKPLSAHVCSRSWNHHKTRH